MPVGGHHPHVLCAYFPKHAIQNRAALFRRRSERGVRDKLLEIAGRNAERLLELYRRKAWKLAFWKTEQFEFGSPTLECDPLVTGCGYFGRRRREFARDFRELPGRDGDRTRSFDVCGHFRTDGDVQVSTGNADALLRCLDKEICQNRESCLCRDGWCHSRKPFLKLLSRDGETHSRPRSEERRMWIPRQCSYLLNSIEIPQ